MTIGEASDLPGYTKTHLENASYEISEMFSRVKGDPSIQDPEAYKKAYNKYATAYGNEPMKDDPKVAKAGTGKFMVKGMGAAIRGGLTKGSS